MRTLLLLALAAISPTIMPMRGATAQESGIAHPLTLLGDLLQQHGTTVLQVSPTVALLSAYTMTEIDPAGCTATVRHTQRSPDLPSLDEVQEYQMDLRLLSPEVGFTPVPRAKAFRADVATSSGLLAIRTMHHRGGASTVDSTSNLGILLRDSTHVDSVRALLAAGVRACGGRPQSAEARAAAATQNAAVSARTDSILGRTLLSDQREQVTTACQVRVRAKLRAPSTAIFAESTLVSEARGLVLMGTVETQVVTGGFSTLTYACLLDQHGTEFLVTNVIVS